jgi:hypothetical protein
MTTKHDTDAPPTDSKSMTASAAVKKIGGILEKLSEDERDRAWRALEALFGGQP